MSEAGFPSPKRRDLFSILIVQRSLGELGSEKGRAGLMGNVSQALIQVRVVWRGRFGCGSGGKDPLERLQQLPVVSIGVHAGVRVCLCVCAHSLYKQASRIPSSWTVQWKVSSKMQYIIFHEFNRVFMILQSASTRHSRLEAAQQET